MIKNSKKGFTLIEILVVVAIIAILSSVVLIGLGPTRRAGRDARRISDLRQVQSALELYFNHCGSYPGISAASVPANCANSGALSGPAGYTAMSTAVTSAALGITQSTPNDPTNATPNVYSYDSNGTSYVLSSKLEDSGNPALQGQAAINPYPPTCGLNSIYCVSL